MKKSNPTLAERAKANSIKSFGSSEAEKRFALNDQLRSARERDRRIANPTLTEPSYGVSSNAHLNQLIVAYYNRDFIRDIEYHRQKRENNYVVLEVGCGGGTAANDLALNRLQKIGGKIKVMATGTKWISDWEKYRDNVEFHVAHAEQLSRVFKPESVDFIHSNLGIGNTNDKTRALNEAHRILRKGGRLLFTSETDVEIPESLFKIIDVKKHKLKSQPLVDLRVYYFEKV